MNVALFLGIAFVVSAMVLIWLFRQGAEDIKVGKQKLTREQKAMKAMGAKF